MVLSYNENLNYNKIVTEVTSFNYLGQQSVVA
jgi:hypothetical protein